MTNAEHAVLECGFLANDALKAYIAIHDRIFAEQATIASLFKNLVGTGTPFEELLVEAKKADRLWLDFSDFAGRTRSKHRASVSEEEARFLDSVVEYAAAVLATTQVLVERQELLLKRKHNPSEVSWQAFTGVQKRYEVAVERYRSLGRDLNPRIHRVFDLANERLKKNP
jgi:hypothetical protein